MRTPDIKSTTSYTKCVGGGGGGVGGEQETAWETCGRVAWFGREITGHNGGFEWRAMRILHLNDHLSSRGGIETYLLSIVPQLEAAGHAITVAFGGGHASLVNDGACVEAIGSPVVSRRTEARGAVRELIESRQPHVVHLHNVQNVGAITACLETTPTLFTCHDYRYLCPASTYYFRGTQEICGRTCGAGCFTETVMKRCMSPHPVRGWRQYSRVRWMQENYGRFRRVIAPSASAARRLSSAGFENSQVQVLPYFCPTAPLNEPRPLPERPTLLYIGRLSENKGWRYFIEALGKLPAVVQGRMVGNFTPEREAEVRRCAAAAGCGERLSLFPWAGRDEIVEHYRQATAMVFPSIWEETLGIVGLESLACGVPVIASDVGGVREWLVENVTGMLVPPKDSVAIVREAERLLASPEENRRMGEAGIELMREKFDPELHMESLVDEYRMAAAGVDTKTAGAV